LNDVDALAHKIITNIFSQWARAPQLVKKDISYQMRISLTQATYNHLKFLQRLNCFRIFGVFLKCLSVLLMKMLMMVTVPRGRKAQARE